MIDQFIDLDKKLFFTINHDWQNGLMDMLCPFIRTQSNWYPAYAVLIYFLFTRFKKQTWWILLGIALTILITDQLSSGLIKNAFQRLRPCNDPDMNAQVRLLVHCGKGFSFTSSHAANHFAAAILMGNLLRGAFRWIWPMVIIWASSIAISQVYVGVHFPLDIFFGSLLGIGTGSLGIFLMRKYIPTSQTQEI